MCVDGAMQGCPTRALAWGALHLPVHADFCGSWVAAQALVGGRASARECGGCGTALRHTQRSSPLPRSPWSMPPPVPPPVPARCSARQKVRCAESCLSPGAHLVHQFRDGRGCTGGIGRREGQGDGRDDEQPCHRQRRHVNELCGRLGHRSGKWFSLKIVFCSRPGGRITGCQRCTIVSLACSGQVLLLTSKIFHFHM